MAMTDDERQTSTGVVDGAGSGPTRMCVGCRARDAQSRLLRFGLRRHAAGQPGQVAPTIGARPSPGGRSAYLCPRRECFEHAIKRRVFTRAFCATSGKRTKRGQAGPSGPSIGMGAGRGNSSGGDAHTAGALWAATIDILRCEIDLLDRCAAQTHAHLRRRGLERLLFELSSQPAPSDRRSSVNRQGGTPTHG